MELAASPQPLSMDAMIPSRIYLQCGSAFPGTQRKFVTQRRGGDPRWLMMTDEPEHTVGHSLRILIENLGPDFANHTQIGRPSTSDTQSNHKL
jgi:hypothetical protein